MQCTLCKANTKQRQIDTLFLQDAALGQIPSTWSFRNPLPLNRVGNPSAMSHAPIDNQHFGTLCGIGQTTNMWNNGKIHKVKGIVRELYIFLFEQLFHSNNIALEKDYLIAEGEITSNRYEIFKLMVVKNQLPDEHCDFLTLLSAFLSVIAEISAPFLLTVKACANPKKMVNKYHWDCVKA